MPMSEESNSLSNIACREAESDVKAELDRYIDISATWAIRIVNCTAPALRYVPLPQYNTSTSVVETNCRDKL